MTPEQLADAIGEIDDDLIVPILSPADHPPTNHSWWWIFGITAACVAVSAGIIGVNSRKSERLSPIESPPSVKTSDNETGAADTYTGGAVSVLPSAGQGEVLTPFYYLRDGAIKCRWVTHEPTFQAIFDVWKNLNFIGEEVQLLSMQTETLRENDISASVMQRVCTLTITQTLADYYTVHDQELLLQSLKQTLSAAADTPPDTYRLILTEESL